MTTTAREIGTLIVVVLKAVRFFLFESVLRLSHFYTPSCPLQRNLPNKRQFGKQDPYCVVVLNGQTRKTKVIKRGGQHPEWDEEIRFTIYEDPEGLRGSNDGTPPPLPPKAGRGPKKIQGGEKMTLACFAADREPELIGETMIDLTEALTKGETDGTLLFLCTMCHRACLHAVHLRAVQNGSLYFIKTSTRERSI